jgi:hypothetical protein
MHTPPPHHTFLAALVKLGGTPLGTLVLATLGLYGVSLYFLFADDWFTRHILLLVAVRVA